VLAAKCSLAIRVDALGDSVDATVGLEAREKVEARLRQLEGRALGAESGKARGKGETPKYDKSRQGVVGALATTPKAYNADADVAEASTKVGGWAGVGGWVGAWGLRVGMLLALDPADPPA